MTGVFRVLALLSAVLLTACAAGSDRPNASADVVARAAVPGSNPPSLTLYTMINNRTGAGAHTSLLVNASQRVIFDPAGTVRFTDVPERGDVLYGITPAFADAYESAHARETYHVVVQQVSVSPEVAERALQLVTSNGRVASARCAAVTSALLRQLPGFEGIGSTWFPKRLMQDFAELPGVTTRRRFEDDADDKQIAVDILEAELRAQ